ncbi:unnamed protein product, partial [Choristocarpus tenellus]
GLEEGDVVVTIEYCHGCERHQMTTRHNAQAYLQNACAARDYIIDGLRTSAIRLAVTLKPAHLNSGRQQASRLRVGGGGGTKAGLTVRRRDRVGAFEIQVAARASHSDTKTHTVHSKLSTGCWPRLTPGFLARVTTILISWGLDVTIEGESNQRNQSSKDGVEEIIDTIGADRLLLSPWEFDRRRRRVNMSEAGDAAWSDTGKRGGDMGDDGSNHGNSGGSSSSRDGMRRMKGIDYQVGEGSSSDHVETNISQESNECRAGGGEVGK